MSLKDHFNTYTAGAPDMDGRTFVKILKDNKIIDGKKYTQTDADLLFTKSKDKGGKRINFVQFEKALGEVATKKGVDVSEIKDAITSGGGPRLVGTKTEDVRFHDDKSLYTGVHAKGGPDTKGGPTLTNICDRSAADVRGVGANKGK